MVKMLDILEAFLDHRQLTYVRVDESLTPEDRQVNLISIFFFLKTYIQKLGIQKENKDALLIDKSIEENKKIASKIKNE